MGSDTMNRSGALLVLMSTLFASTHCREDSVPSDGHPGSPEPSTDAHTDGPTDAKKQDSTDGLTGCDSLEAEWADFLTTHRSCNSSSECSLVGGSGGPLSWCVKCGPSIGASSGDVIASSALLEAQPFLDKFEQCVAEGQWSGCTWDAAPAKNLRCEGGTCMADPGYCHVFDSSPPADDGPDAELDAPDDGSD